MDEHKFDAGVALYGKSAMQPEREEFMELTA